jgi:PAS domain S-box-containing protein
MFNLQNTFALVGFIAVAVFFAFTEEGPQNFTFRANGFWGAVVGALGVLAVAVPLSIAIWKNFGRPIWDWWRGRDSYLRRLAFTEFRLQWLEDHSSKPIIILDDKIKCIEVNEALCRLLQVDSSEVKGRGWHKLVKESELERVRAKWLQAYNDQGPFTIVCKFMVGRRERRFLMEAEPFVFNGKVRNMHTTMELLENQDVDVSVSPPLLRE